MGQFICRPPVEEVEEDPLAQLLKTLPEDVLIKILLYVENNFKVFYVNIFRMYPCFRRRHEAIIEKTLRTERNKRILKCLHYMPDDKYVYIGSDLVICGKRECERSTLKMDEYRLIVRNKDVITTGGKVWFYQNDTNGFLIACANINEVRSYNLVTAHTKTIPAYERHYLIHGIFMNECGIVSLKFI